MSTLTIRTAAGAIRHTTEINIGSRRIRQLGGKDCVLLRFSLAEPVAFAIGDRCDIPGEGRFHLVETPSPAYNASTGGYDYELSMEPTYRLGANKVLAPHPGAHAETEFKFTATVAEHLAVVSKCMEHHAIRYHDPATGTDVKYIFAVDDTVKTDARYIQYSGHTLISALDAIASEWECEWWADGSVIRFGKCEQGDIITVERDVNVSDIRPSGRDPRRHTRLYAFGGTENIPPYYRRKMVFKVTRVDGSDIYDDEHPLTLDMLSKTTHTADPNASVRVNRSTAGTGSVTPSLTSGVFYTVREESYLLQSMKHGTWRIALSKFKPKVSFADGRPYDAGHCLRFKLELTWTDGEGAIKGREFVSEVRYFPTPTDYTPTWQDDSISLPVDSNISFKLTIDFMAAFLSDDPATIAYNTTSVPLTLSFLSPYDSAEGLDIDRISPTGSAIAGVKFNALHKPVVGSMPLTLPAGTTMAVGDTFTIQQLSRLNIPAAWYSTPAGEPITDATTTNRLRLPEDTPYVDAYPDLADTEAVECSHVFDDIYPRQDNTVSEVWPIDVTATDDDGATVTLRRYCLASTGLDFSADDIIRDQELRIKFISGLLNGMTFGVTWHPSGVVTESAVISDACFEVVASGDYGRRLPDTILRPQTGDKFILLGWASDTLFDQLLEAAEEELKEKAIEWQQAQLTQGETYDCPLIPSVAKEGIPAIGQRVKVVEPSLFPKGYHVTRVIGFEYPLDIPIDNPTIKIGDRIPSRRLDDIEERVNKMGTIEDFSAPPSQEIDNITAIVSADLSNQADTVVFNDLGQIVGGLPSTTVNVWVDGVKASGVALSIDESYPGLGFSVEGDTVRVSSADMTMPPRTEVEITATFAAAGRVTSRTLVFTVLMRRGDARYQLLPSATAIHVRPDKTLVPASGSLTCAVLMTSGGEPGTLTPAQTRLIGLVLQWRVDEVSWQTWSETSGNPTYTDTNSNIQWRLMQQGECIDIETIPFVVDGEDGKDGTPGKDGESPYVLDLSNEMDSVPCDAQGNVLAGVALPSTSFAVYVGSRKDTGWTFSTLSTGCTANLDSAAGTLTLTAITADRATVKLMADKGAMRLEALFTVTKVRGGGRGSDAVIYRLHPSVDKVSRDKSGNATPSSLYVNVAKTVGNAQVEVPESFGTVKYSIDGGAETALAYTATGKTEAVTIGATARAVTFCLYSADGTTLLDKERVPVIADGKDMTYSDFVQAGGLSDLAQNSALQSSVGDLLRGSSPYTIEFSPAQVAVINKTGAAWSRTVTLIANRIAAMQSVAGGTWSVVSTEGTDVTASVTGNQLTVGGKASGGKVTVRFTGPDLSQVERTLSVGVAVVADGLPGGKGDPGKDMTYSDFVAGGGIGALAANTDLISGVKSGIDTSAFRSDIGGLIKADVKTLLKNDSGFVALTKGEPGSKGDKGDKGDQGIQGLKGTDGISPHIGNDGYWYSGSTKLSVKAQGPTGSQGLQGPKGDQGLKGNDGAKGDKGDKGDTPVLSLNSSYQLLADGALVSSASLRGPQGLTGTPGAKGDKGDQGIQGPQGLKGDTPVLSLNSSYQLVADGKVVSTASLRGPQGLQGPQGTKGADGAKGDQGPRGVQGPQGPQGTKGADGAKGDQGPRGVQGPQGPQGVKGDTGATGLNWAAGKMLYTDPTFAEGKNHCSLYNNAGNGVTTVARQAGDWPNNSGYGLVIRNTGSASPGLGGFSFNSPCSKGRIYVVRIIANIPSGYDLNYVSNSTGNNGTFSWHSSRAGVGSYREYVVKVTCGWTGTFSTIGFFYLTGPAGSSSSPVTWYVSYATIFDLTESDGYSKAIAAKASLSDVQQAGFVKYANGKLTYCSGLTCSDLNVSSASHNHDGVYAKISHTHSQYLTSHQSLANYVTTDTVQTITAIKNFSGRLRIIGSAAAPAYNSASALTFTENTNDEQAVSLVYTSYDFYRAPAGLKLMGAQGNEWFEAPRFIRSGGTASQVLMADGSVQTHWKAADVASATSDVGMITPLAMNNWTSKTYAKISHTHSQYLTSHQSLANYVTTDTVQTITAIKNFSGRLRIIGSAAAPAYNSASALTFTENTNDEQAVSLVYTSYDFYRAPAGLKLMGAQGNEWFEAPRFIRSGGTASQVLMADGSVQTHWKAADVASATSDVGMITPLAMNNWTSKTFVKKTGGTISAAIRDVLTISGSASTGAAINLNNNGKQGVFGMNSNGLWFQNLYGANQPYIQLLNDGGFVLDKGTAGRFDILHDGNIYDYCPPINHPVHAPTFSGFGSGSAVKQQTAASTVIDVRYNVTTNRFVWRASAGNYYANGAGGDFYGEGTTTGRKPRIGAVYYCNNKLWVFNGTTLKDATGGSTPAAVSAL